MVVVVFLLFLPEIIHNIIMGEEDSKIRTEQEG